MPGWRGTVLRIDLTAEKITKQSLDRLVARNFIGGRGFNSLTLFKEVKPGIDPLGPENVLCLAPGALTGTGLALSSRIEVSTFSPYSGILGDGSAGREEHPSTVTVRNNLELAANVQGMVEPGSDQN
jgi:aldehyde:ferredoxin oxidoreductase